MSLIQLANIDSTILDISLFDSIPFHVYAKDLSGKYLEMNQAMARDIGINKPEEFIGFRDFDMPYLPYDEAKNLRNNDESVMKFCKSAKFIQPVTIVDNIKVNLLSYKAPLYTRSKKAIGLMGVSLIQNLREYNSHTLTERQIDCLVLLVKGMTFKEIGKALRLSPRTVEHYIFAIKTKFNCETRSELITKALKMEIIKSRL